jgi:hypothetical protein
MHNKKPLAVQITAEVEEPTLEDLLVAVRSWNPVTWELSDTYEIYCSKGTTLSILGNLLGGLFGIPESELECCKIGSAWNFSRVQLPSEQWVKTMGNQCFIVSSPFYLSVDGGLLIVKKSGCKERELNADERLKYAAFDYEVHGTYKSVGKGPKKEKAIKIHVYQTKADEPEEKKM